MTGGETFFGGFGIKWAVDGYKLLNPLKSSPISLVTDLSSFKKNVVSMYLSASIYVFKLSCFDMRLVTLTCCPISEVIS